jgi:quercetin dioxygenase-like cupin family protein
MRLCRLENVMSFLVPEFSHSVIKRGVDAETLGANTGKIRLLVDSNATGGALSSVRVTLEKGSDGARPHRHDRSAEMFYVLEGSVRVLSGSQVISAEAGDVIVVPPKMPHAFSTERGSSADLLIVIAPGVERFEYFRQLSRIARGQEAPESLRDVQDLYDTYFLSSPEWEAARR